MGLGQCFIFELECLEEVVGVVVVVMCGVGDFEVVSSFVVLVGKEYGEGGGRR